MQRAFDFAATSVLCPSVLHAGRGGTPCAAPAECVAVPTWTVRAPAGASRALGLRDARVRVEAMLTARGGGMEWRGSAALALRVLTVAREVFAAGVAGATGERLERLALGFAPAPGGALDALMDGAYRWAVAAAKAVVAAEAARGQARWSDAAAARATRALLDGFAAAPAWSLPHWDGSGAAPRDAAGRVRYCVRARTLPAVGVRLEKAALGVMRRVERGLGTAPGAALSAYRAGAEAMLEAAWLALRLLSHARFCLDRHVALLDAPVLDDALATWRAWRACLRVLSRVATLPDAALATCLFDARGWCRLPPALLVEAERRMAGTWERRAGEVAARAWRIVGADDPSKVGFGGAT